MPRCGDPALAATMRDELTVPIIVAPMFLVSSVDLVVASARAGVMAAIPTLNARSTGILDRWLGDIRGSLDDVQASRLVANLIVHSSNGRLDADLACVVAHRVPVVLASVGSPAAVIAPVKAYGGLVFSDAATVHHARRAAEAGVDGLVLLCAGAGGHTGSLSPFAFVEEVRKFFDGPIAVAGGIGTGRQIRAAEMMGADLAMMGTAFIATRESDAGEGYREMVVESGADDVVLTSAVTGLPANMLRRSLELSGFSDAEHPKGSFSIGGEEETLRAWRDVWGAGHGVGATRATEPAATVIERLAASYDGLT